MKEEIIDSFALKETPVLTIRSQEPVMLSAIGLWPCFPPPRPYSPGASLKSHGWSPQSDAAQPASRHDLTRRCGTAEFLDGPQELVSSEPPCRDRRMGFVCSLLLSSDMLCFPSRFDVFVFVFAAPLHFVATCVACQAEIPICYQMPRVLVLNLYLGASPSQIN